MSKSREEQSLRLWIQIVRLANSLQKDVDTRLRREHGQSLSRFDVLSQLQRVPKHCLTVGQLSARLLTPTTNITRLLDRMEKDGLLKRELSPSDRRSFLVTATTRGLQVFSEMAAQNSDWIARAFETVDDSQMAALSRALAGIEISEGDDAERA